MRGHARGDRHEVNLGTLVVGREPQIEADEAAFKLRWGYASDKSLAFQTDLSTWLRVSAKPQCQWY